MSNVKYTLGGFSAGDYRAVERYLNDRAAAGWDLERAGMVLAKWRRTERKDLRWCVDLASTRQSREERLDYVDFCREGGWDLAAYTGGMYLFRSRPGEEAIPVQTDPVLERKNYNRYYIRNCILSVVIVLAWIGFYALMGWGLGGDYWGAALTELRRDWAGSWTLVLLLPAATLWGLCAVWKLADFCAGLWRARGGAVPVSPQWVMRTNGVCTVLQLAGAALVLAGSLLDSLLAGGRMVSLATFLAVWGAVCLYRGFLYGEDLFPGERKGARRLGFVFLVLMAALIAARSLSHFGTWSNWDRQLKWDPYGELESAPVVRLEDLDISRGGLGTREVTDVIVPMGHVWQTEHYNDYWPRGVGCESVLCPTAGQAERLAAQWLAALARSAGGSKHLPRPGADMEPADLGWADGAWRGTYRDDGADYSVLLLRAGRLVCRLVVPGELDEGGLAAVEARLSPWATER